VSASRSGGFVAEVIAHRVGQHCDRRSPPGRSWRTLGVCNRSSRADGLWSAAST
jgi:hypothetical protein